MRGGIVYAGAAVAAGALFLVVGAAIARPGATPPRAAAANGIPLYKNPAASVDARVDDLMKRMTLDEKIAQMLCVWTGKTAIFDDNLQFDEAKAKVRYPNGVGQLARPSDRKGPVSPRLLRLRDAKETVALVNAVQHWAVNDTRLGIPVLFHEEGLHGYATMDGTNFPQAIALASSWDPDLVRDVDTIVAREIRARGVSLVLSPVVDVARDPRWGRIEETFGEDPYLVSQMGVAAIEGLQGDQLPLADGKVFATLKHFTGHGQPESGTNAGPAQISERTLRENFFPPFEEAIRRTNVRSLMASYNEIDGVPSHENAWLLGKVLRGEWGYKGAIVSDYYGIEQLDDLHHVVGNYTGRRDPRAACGRRYGPAGRRRLRDARGIRARGPCFRKGDRYGGAPHPHAQIPGRIVRTPLRRRRGRGCADRQRGGARGGEEGGASGRRCSSRTTAFCPCRQTGWARSP